MSLSACLDRVENNLSEMSENNLVLLTAGHNNPYIRNKYMTVVNPQQKSHPHINSRCRLLKQTRINL